MLLKVLVVCLVAPVGGLIWASVAMNETVILDHVSSIVDHSGYWTINNTQVVEKEYPHPIPDITSPYTVSGSKVFPNKNVPQLFLNGRTVPLSGNYTDSLPFVWAGFPKHNPYYGSGTRVSWWQLNLTIWNINVRIVELGETLLQDICNRRCLW